MPEAALPTGPIVYRDFQLARVGKNYRNGKVAFDLARADLEGMVRNFQAFRGMVPAYLLPDHPDVNGAYRSAGPTDGWAERLWMDGDLLMVRLKLHGRAAVGVANDEYRGVSLGGFTGKDLHGNPAKWVLDHVLITNSPFFTDLNSRIAASASKGGADAVVYLSAQTEATNMAENDKETPKPAGGGGETAEDKLALQQKEHEKEQVALKAENLRLKEQLEDSEAKLANANVDKDKEAALVENVNLRRRCFAQDVRALVDQGLNRSHTLKAAWCDGFMGKSILDYEGTIRWLKASPKFFDASAPNPEDQALRNLKFVVENGPVQYTVGKSYASGAPIGGPQSLTLSQEDKDLCKRVGSDPERIAAMNDETTYKEWLDLKAQKA